MKSGKKSTAQRIVYGAIEKMAEKLEKGNPVELFSVHLKTYDQRLKSKAAE
jgi:small subunit ribosomal protein S7